MRAAKLPSPSLSSFRRRCNRPWIVTCHGGGGQKYAPRLYQIWSSYVGADGIIPDCGYSNPSAGNPAWPSIVLLLDVPALVMDPEMGLWPRAGSTGWRNSLSYSWPSQERCRIGSCDISLTKAIETLCFG